MNRFPKVWPYLFCFMVGCANCSDSDPVNNTDPDASDDNMQPEASVVSPTEDLTIHQGESVAFESSCDDPDGDLPLTHRWDFGDGSFSEEENPTHAFLDAGTFDVSYTCTDARELESEAAVISVTTTNVAPMLETFEPIDGLVVLPGSVFEFRVTCSDEDDPDTVRGVIELDGVEIDTTTPELTEVGVHTFVGFCEDPSGLTSPPITRTIDVRTPRALYLSNEQKLDHREVMLADTPGSPTVLNQDLLAPGGSVSQFVVANDEVFYFADHGVEDRVQLYQANRVDPSTPREVTTPVAKSGVSNVTVDSTGNRFFYFAQQNVPDQVELFWVDAEAATPTPIELTPTFTGLERVEIASFSPTGRYLAFTTYSPTVQGLDRIFVADLNSGDPAVEVVTGERYQRSPISFSSDERYVLLGGRGLLRAVDLATLNNATPATVDLVPTANNVADFAFIDATLAAVAARENGADVLRVIDVAAEFAGAGQLNEVVYNTSTVESTSSAGRTLHVCGSGLVFSAEAANTFSHEFYYVDLIAWANDFRTTPGTETPPQKVHEDFLGNEDVNSSFFEFSNDCSKMVFLATRDLDSDPNTPDQNVIAWADVASLGTSNIVDIDGDYRTGGLFPDLTFSPNNTYVTWSETDANGDSRAYVSSLVTPGEIVVLSAIDGEVKEFYWRSDDVLLAFAERGSAPGLYEWAVSDPLNPALFAAGATSSHIDFSADEQELFYLETFGPGANQVTKTDLPAATLKEKVTGDGTTNGAEISQVWAVNDDTLVLFAGEDEIDGRNKLFAVDPTDPRNVQEIFPGDSDPTATFSGNTLEYIASNNTVVFQGSVQANNGLYIADLNAMTAATRVDTAPAETFVSFYALSPDGKQVMFRGTVNGVNHVFVKDLSGNAPAVSVYEGIIRENGKATFSPNSRYGTFLVDRNPTYAFVFDVQNLGDGATPLLPANYPEDLPRSPSDPTLAATTGVTVVGFGATSEWVYFGYDHVYSRHFKAVRKNLADLNVEEVLSPPDVGSETIDLLEPLQGQDSMLYRKTVFPNGEENGSIDVLVAVDGATPGVERVLTPTLDTQDRGVVNFLVHQEFVSFRVDTQNGGETHYVASIDGDVAAFPLNQPLEDNTALRVLAVSRVAGAIVVSYTAQQTGDVSPQLYLTTYADEVNTQTRVDIGDSVSPIVSVDPSGLWVYWESVQNGVSDGLFTGALVAPSGPYVQLSATPIVDGSVEVPAATLR